MQTHSFRGRSTIWLWFLLVICRIASAGGLTVITHGYGGNVGGWVAAMGSKIAQYPAFPGTNASIYKLSVTLSNGAYSAQPTFLDGAVPTATDSGEVIVLLDWSSISTSSQTASTDIAQAAMTALLNPNLLNEIGGHALAELPMHLIGHSRGASVVTEMARLFGAQGIWVDHVTTLDPYPFFGDPAVKNFANILFLDNYWEGIDFIVHGQALAGAFNRKLTSLDGGNSLAHSDVHLWYHATIFLATPCTDTEATIYDAQRTTWWTTVENRGTNAGFLYSLIGRGDRLSSLDPVGDGKQRIRDGFNNYWDLGAQVGGNRLALPTNNGTWPNVIRAVVASTSPVPADQPIRYAFYYQSGTNLAGPTLETCLDPDPNPWNGNESLAASQILIATGTNSVGFQTASFTPDPLTTHPGTYRLLLRTRGQGHTRCFYAPEPVVITASLQAPLLVDAHTSGTQFQFKVQGLPGQKIAVETALGLKDWVGLATNTLNSTSWDVDAPLLPDGACFYRALLIE